MSCRAVRWNGQVVCSRQYTAEAFSFIALSVISTNIRVHILTVTLSFTTLMALCCEIAFIYAVKAGTVREKQDVQAEERIARNLSAAGVL